MARYDLSVHAALKGKAVELNFLWPSEVFETARMEALADQFATLAAAVAERPSLVPASHRAFGEAERRRWTVRPAADGASLPARIAAAIDAHPQAPAIVSGSRTLTYGALDRACASLAARLVERGAGPEATVAIRLADPLHAALAMVATLRAGAAFLVIDPNDPDPAADAILADATPTVLIAAEPAPHTASHLCATKVEAALGDLAMSDVPWAEPHPEAAAYRVYTSGSTGERKGVVVRHDGLSGYLRWLERSLDLTPSDRAALVTSLAFDLGLTNLFGALSTGGSVVLMEEATRRAPSRAIAAIAEHGVTWLKTTPSWLGALAQDPSLADLAQSRLRLVITGGERQDGAALRSFAAAVPGATLTGSYGPTEATISCAGGPIELDDASRVGDLGAPADGVSLMVLDEAMRPAPLGSVGELYLAGPALARGYQGRAGETAAAFVAHPYGGPGERMYRTGDRVRRRADGALDFVGRTDRQVKVSGHRVELGEVERALVGSPRCDSAVADVRAVGVSGSSELIAWVTGAARVDDIKAELRRRLPAHMIPATIVPLAALPMTANGKVDRAALPEPRRTGEGRAVRPPLDGDETLLCALFAEITGSQDVGADDDFFALGGHSLAMMRLLSRIRSETGVEPSLAAVFAAPTPAAIARHLATARPARVAPTARRRGATAPVSFAQQRLWFIDRLADGTSAYNMPEPLRLRGDLDVEALEAALGALVARHEVLRTTFAELDGAPHQRVHPARPVTLPVEDLTGLNESARQAAVGEALDGEWSTPFDLAAGTLIRMRLLKLGAHEHVLLRTCHHIASDGWSAGVMNREIAELYSAFVRGEPDPFPPLAIQYADYALWQRDPDNAGTLEVGLNWWRRTLEGAPRALALATDRPRPPRQTFCAALARASVAPDVTAALQTHAERRGGTLFESLATAFAALLGRETGQTDLVFGTVVANRDDPVLEPMVGFFVNTVALRFQPQLDRSFAENFTQGRDVVRAGFAHQDTPFEQLVDHVAPRRNEAFNPICQVILTLQNVRQGQATLPGLTVEALPSQTLKVRFDLEVHTVETGGGLALYFVYNRDLFDAWRMEAMAARFAAFLAAAVGRPDAPMATLFDAEPPVGAALSMPAASRAGLGSTEAMHQDAPAILGAEGAMSRAELARRTESLARRLAAMGCGPRTVVGVAADTLADEVAAALAVIKTGATLLQIPAASGGRGRCRQPHVALLSDRHAPRAPGTARADVAAGERGRARHSRDPPRRDPSRSRRSRTRSALDRCVSGHRPEPPPRCIRLRGARRGRPRCGDRSLAGRGGPSSRRGVARHPPRERAAVALARSARGRRQPRRDAGPERRAAVRDLRIAGCAREPRGGRCARRRADDPDTRGRLFLRPSLGGSRRRPRRRAS